MSWLHTESEGCKVWMRAELAPPEGWTRIELSPSGALTISAKGLEGDAIEDFLAMLAAVIEEQATSTIVFP